MTHKAINWNRIQDDKDLEVWNRLTANFWLPEKVPLSNDAPIWKQLSGIEQDITMRVFAGLTMLDTIQGSIGAVSLLPDAETQHEEAVYTNIAFMEALVGDTELLTVDGWKQVQYVDDSDVVAQYNPETGHTEFVTPKIVPSHYAEETYEIAANNGNGRQVVSGGHRVMIEEKVRKNNQCKEWVVKAYEARDLPNLNTAHRRFRSAAPMVPGVGLTARDKFLIALAADGSICGKRYTGEKVGTVPARFTFAKERKIRRLLSICEELGYGVRETTPSGARRNFYVDVPLEVLPFGRDKSLANVFTLASFNGTKAQEFVAELGLWDGHTLKGGGGVTFYTTNPEEADMVVAVSQLAGYRSRKTVREDERSESFSDTYVVNICFNRQHVGAASVTVKRAAPQEVYCVQVPSTFIVTRNGESPVITGNCVHAKSYSSIFSTLASTRQIDDVFLWSERDEQLQAKADIITRYYHADDPLKKKIASTLLESFLFYSGFYWPLYLSSHAKLTNTADVIRLIIRDEAVHGYYIGYKFQRQFERETPERQAELEAFTYDLLDELYENEVNYTASIYDEIGLTSDVVNFLHYNANKALNNLGFDSLFPGELTKFNPGVMTSLNPGADENHDFFSGSGSSYVIKAAVSTEDEDWDF